MTLREADKTFSFDGSSDVATDPQAYDYDGFPASLDRIVAPAFAAKESAQNERSKAALESFRGALTESERAMQWLHEAAENVLDEYDIPEAHRPQLRPELLECRTKMDMQLRADGYNRAFARPLAPKKTFNFEGDNA